MWFDFIFTNLHFGIDLFSALVLFAMFWLYFDAWWERKNIDQVPKLAGILLLSISFVVLAVQIDSGSIPWVFTLTHVLGYVLLVIGLAKDPLQAAPKTASLTENFGVFGLSVNSSLLNFASPLLSIVVAFLYWRRATKGMEKHLKTVALVFLFLAVFEILSLFSLFRNTAIVGVSELLALFGPVWIVQHVVLLLGMILLARWVWRYLTKRLEPQLFMIFVGSILGIFLLTTVVFTSQLLRNMQVETFSRLETDVKVLSYGLDSRKFQIQSDALSFASRQDYAKMIGESNKVALAPVVAEYLLSKNLSSLVVVDGNAQVIARGENLEQIGESLSGDPLVARGLSGKSAVSVVVGQGVMAPTVMVRAISPIVSSGKQVGAVIAGLAVDNAFVDGIKTATGLEAAVYGGDVLAATTQTATDGTSRWVGTKMQNKTVVTKVLEAGEPYSGSQNVLNTPYFVSLVPLRDLDDVVVGMLFVGRHQATVLAAASDSLQSTFVYSVVLMVLAIFPAYFVSKFLSDQLR